MGSRPDVAFRASLPSDLTTGLMKTSASTLRASMIAAAVLLGACGGQTADDAMASGKSYLAKRDSKAAVIQFKNVLQKQPDSAEARFLLGQSLMQDGDPASALVEFGKALDLKQPESMVVPEMARALIAARDYRKLTDRYRATAFSDRAATASLKASLALAYSAQNDLAQSRAALQAAFAAVPDYPAALTVEARNRAAEGHYDDALRLIEKVLAAKPADTEAWQVKADILLYGKAEPASALAAYKKALEVDPGHLSSRVGVITVLMSQQNFKDAKNQVDELAKRFPNNLFTKYFKAQLAYVDKDYKTARELLQQALRIAPENAKVLHLAGVIEFNSTAFGLAENYFAKALQSSPRSVSTRAYLARTYIRSGQPQKALAALQPALESPNPDSEIYATAAEAYLQSGDVANAEKHFERAAKLNPADTRSRTAVALAHMTGAAGDAALAELQAISAADNNTYADQALVSTYIRKQQFDKALKAVDAIAKKQPDKPLADNLRGRIHLMRKDVVEARRSFERALSIDPVFIPAAASLAALDIADKQPAAARKRFESVLAADKQNVPALLALAELKARDGSPREEVTGMLAGAVRTNPSAITPRLALINYLLGSKEPKRALVAAQDATAALPQSNELLEALGRAQIAAGETNQAVISFTNLVARQPESPQPYLRLAAAYVASNNLDAARQNLRRALSVSPNLLDAQQALLKIEIDANRSTEALAIARTVQKQRPSEVIGYSMEGSVESARKNHAAAVDIYRAALKRFDSNELAMRLYTALRASSKQSDADAFAASWLQAHPKDAGFVFYLGETALVAGDLALAHTRFQQTVDIVPDNALALNNLAWTMAKLNKPGAAAYAQRAVALLPDKAAFLDTLAVALAAENQLPKAIEAAKSALALEPDSTALRLNLAKMYIKSGEKAAAKSELEVLSKLEGKSEAQAEVNRLLKTL